MASTKGAYLKNIRYDFTTPQRIEKYIERESWNKKQWHEWVDSKLNETLYNARKYVYEQDPRRGRSGHFGQGHIVRTLQLQYFAPYLTSETRPYENAKYGHDHR